LDDLSRFGVVVQAALSDCVSFDPFAFEQYGLAVSEVDAGRGEIAETLVVSAVIVMRDKMWFLSVWRQRSTLSRVCGWPRI
jgi:hypothetical protein